MLNRGCGSRTRPCAVRRPRYRAVEGDTSALGLRSPQDRFLNLRADLPLLRPARKSRVQRASCYRKRHLLLVIAGFLARSVLAQNVASEASASPSASPSPTPIVFSERTLADLKQLQQAALSSDYAFRQVAHLSNNIGPRLTGSAQARKAVEYVAAEMKALGCEVQLEKVIVPHWVRGEENAALVQCPGEAEGTTNNMLVTSLSARVGTPGEGSEA